MARLNQKKKKEKKNQQREKVSILISNLSKKRKYNFTMYHATPWKLLVQISACSEWLYIVNFFGNKQKEKGELASP